MIVTKFTNYKEEREINGNFNANLLIMSEILYIILKRKSYIGPQNYCVKNKDDKIYYSAPFFKKKTNCVAIVFM
jgi:hypothetical protein